MMYGAPELLPYSLDCCPCCSELVCVCPDECACCGEVVSSGERFCSEACKEADRAVQP